MRRKVKKQGWHFRSGNGIIDGNHKCICGRAQTRQKIC